MASLIPDSLLADVFAGNVNTSHTFKMMLCTSAYTPSRAHNRRDDVTNEVSGTNYTAGGATVTLTITTDTTNHKTTLTVGGASWASSTITARTAVVYRARGGASSADELVIIIENPANVSSSGTTFAVAASTWEIPHPTPV
jgi:hypothetical protein